MPIRPAYALHDFAIESNTIEGVFDMVRHDVHEAALRELLTCRTMTVANVVKFVGTIQPGAKLRSQSGMDVFVGGRACPPGGNVIKRRLMHLLGAFQDCDLTPYELHVQYELLHPFTDGNGRSGRALWLWGMDKYRHYTQAGQMPFKFLQMFYYQTLAVAAVAVK